MSSTALMAPKDLLSRSASTRSVIDLPPDSFPHCSSQQTK
jgi:hypothetical protein